jgi:tetraacyldisaccharide 4'-kinase
MLLAASGCDVVIADDGLQHYALARDVELAVVDASRGLGNGRCLPAGPLREPAERLEEVDLLIVNGGPSPQWPGACAMNLAASGVIRLSDGARRTVEAFARQHPTVHAVAGIGNPERFAVTLEQAGMSALLHPYPDHHEFTGPELEFDDALPVVCTEKDAIKIRQLEPLPDDCWYLEVEVVFALDEQARLQEVLERHGIVAS